MNSRARVIILFVILAVFGLTIPSPAIFADTVGFTGGELLGKPTDSSITINIVPDAAIEYYFEFGTSPGAYTVQTTPATAAAGQPNEVVVMGLSPNTHYYYRMVYDGDGSVTDGDYEVRDEHTFYTQRARGNSFVFTVTSDSHGNFGTNTPANILSNGPDFNVDLGDTFMVDHLG